ncbi:uncharacterized protein LOC142237033 isoform X1 [Haematobia irritans]|uniref:uncharacterized protein LOC142237033 isoform X1 n=1 Tax=Haematobia irritans TaxID=7368 RepID=UPI003F50AF16
MNAFSFKSSHFRILCSFQILLTITTCTDLLQFFLLRNATIFASCKSVVDNDKISTENNFSVKNQIIVDTLQLKSPSNGDNDLLSLVGVVRCSNETTDVVEHPEKVKMPASCPSSSTQSLSVPSAASSELLWSSPSSSSSPISLQHRLLSRPKRYLSFPEGASFSVAVCFTIGIIGNPRFDYMAFGLNWGVAYDLPNTTWILHHLHGFAKRPIPTAMWHRRSRRALYKEVEHFIDNMGYNGRDCVLRALCESRQYFQNTKMGMIGEMLRAIFSLPKQRIYKRELEEDSDLPIYDRAYRKRRSADAFTDCSTQYNCNFSLLELAFGKYSTPPPGYYEHH